MTLQIVFVMTVRAFLPTASCNIHEKRKFVVLMLMFPAVDRDRRLPQADQARPHAGGAARGPGRGSHEALPCPV